MVTTGVAQDHQGAEMTTGVGRGPQGWLWWLQGSAEDCHCAVMSAKRG